MAYPCVKAARSGRSHSLTLSSTDVDNPFVACLDWVAKLVPRECEHKSFPDEIKRWVLQVSTLSFSCLEVS